MSTWRKLESSDLGASPEDISIALIDVDRPTPRCRRDPLVVS